MSKTAEAFRTIGEVAETLDVPKHVLRFWEGKFPQIRPMKRGGGRRYYRPEDMELLRGIRHLLHAEGYTIKGVQKILRDHGVGQVKAAARTALELASPTPVPTDGRGVRRRGRKPRASNIETSAHESKEVAGSAQGGSHISSQVAVNSIIKELEACRAAMLALQPRAGGEERASGRQRAGERS